MIKLSLKFESFNILVILCKLFKLSIFSDTEIISSFNEVINFSVPFVIFSNLRFPFPNFLSDISIFELGSPLSFSIFAEKEIIIEYL